MKRWVVLFAFAVLNLACASVKVEKVPHPPSYQLDQDCNGEDDQKPCWNEIQRRADKIKGARYYLPRPYAAVKQEFPVGGGSIFVTGEIDEQGQVLSIETRKLPEALQHVFQTGQVSAESVKAPAEETLAGSGPRVQSESGGVTAEATPSQVTPPTLKADEKNTLKDSTVSHSDVPSAATVITLKVKVSKDALAGDAFGQGPVLDDKKIYLVPFTQGKHTVEGLVSVTNIVAVQGKVGEDRMIEAQVEGSKVPTHASLAVGVQGTVEGKRKDFVLHRTTVDIHNSFASQKKEEKKEETEKKDAEKKVSEAKATVSGDPTTDPLIKVSPLYDVLLLPDFSEQYAIQVRSGVFKASADIGFENGWMAEKLNFDIDNSALGEFLLESATKLVDAGIAKAFPVKAAVDQAQAQPTAQIQSEAKGKSVLLRIDYVEIAVPGLYPLAKVEEQECGFLSNEVRGLAPCVPKIDWRTRVEWAVTLVTAKPTSKAPTENCDPEDIAIDTETFKGVNDVTKFFSNDNVVFTSPNFTPGNDLLLKVANESLKDPAEFDKNIESFQKKIKEVLNKKLTERACPQLVREVKVSKP